MSACHCITHEMVLMYLVHTISYICLKSKIIQLALQQPNGKEVCNINEMVWSVTVLHQILDKLIFEHLIFHWAHGVSGQSLIHTHTWPYSVRVNYLELEDNSRQDISKVLHLCFIVQLVLLHNVVLHAFIVKLASHVVPTNYNFMHNE